MAGGGLGKKRWKKKLKCASPLCCFKRSMTERTGSSCKTISD